VNGDTGESALLALATKVRALSAVAESGKVVLLGDFSNERLNLATIGRDFGWSTVKASDLSELRELGQSETVVAVLIQAGWLGQPWSESLRAVRETLPHAKAILCHRVDQAHSRIEMVDAGAFGVLMSPLAYAEVRQALGFVWASRITPPQKAPAPAKKVSAIDATVRRAGAA
jgi:DNA-binding NtrC family response regulator